VVEAKLTLLQMQIECRTAHSFELNEPGLSKTPEAFNAIDMSIAPNKLVFAMLDSIMLLIAHVHNAIVRTKAVSMDSRRQSNLAANNGLKTGLFAVRDDLRINTAVSFVDAEDDGLASRPASALATHATRPEVRFIQLDIAGKGRFTLAMLGDNLTNQSHITVDRITIQTCQNGNLRGSQIKCKEPKKLPEFSTSYSCADKLLGTNYHDLV